MFSRELAQERQVRASVVGVSETRVHAIAPGLRSASNLIDLVEDGLGRVTDRESSNDASSR